MTHAYANRHGYSDVEPVEILRAISAKTLDVREMKASENLVKLSFTPGGFVGHFEHHKQDYEITSDTAAVTYRIRLNKKGQWLDKHGRSHVLADRPRKFYDFNF